MFNKSKCLLNWRKLTVMGQIDSWDTLNESMKCDSDVSQCYFVLWNLNKIGYIYLSTSHGKYNNLLNIFMNLKGLQLIHIFLIQSFCSCQGERAPQSFYSCLSSVSQVKTCNLIWFPWLKLSIATSTRTKHPNGQICVSKAFIQLPTSSLLPPPSTPLPRSPHPSSLSFSLPPFSTQSKIQIPSFIMLSIPSSAPNLIHS